ncbi:MAG: nicotinamide mononucleotide transporter [Clostridia bacterium]|nr:nicotinamide mononucleotide transporter [Clostridia bacterium]
MRKIKNYFTGFEIGLWMSSVIVITFSYFFFDGKDILTFIASIIGATFLIFNAKGNPIGQFLTIIFSIMYGIISYRFAYYGEMITYLGMTMPMACFALISWLKYPYKNNKAQVKVNKLSKNEYAFMVVLTVVVTVAFYFVLKTFNTANLIFSTLSVTTSFIAVYLTFKRSSFFALAYACNDIVLIMLWILATLKDNSYFSVVICFFVFLVNDIYGFISWVKMEKNQRLCN